MKQLNWNVLKSIEDVVSTPFFIFDEATLVNNYKTLLERFKTHYEKSYIAYACKANNCTSVLKALSGVGAWLEASSQLEYQAMLALVHDPTMIILNGPLKTDDEWLEIQQNNSLGNVDSIEEMKQVYNLARLYPNREFKIGLRLKLPNSRFGIQDDDHVFNWLKESLNKYPNIRYVALHGHANCKNNSLDHFVALTKLLLNTAAHYFPDMIQSINLGGGILHPDFTQASINTAVPSWNDYAQHIANTINEHEWGRVVKPKLYLEPGAGLVTNAFSMVTKVIRVNNSRTHNQVTVDAGSLQVKPTKHKFNIPFGLVKKLPDLPYDSDFFSVYGATCWEDDVLLKNVYTEIPKSGDYLILNRVGAYTLSLMPNFILPAPAIITLGHEQITVLHSRQASLHQA
jgi:diaminopimelate decarboxylase